MVRQLQKDELQPKVVAIRKLQTFYRQFETNETVQRIEVLKQLAGQLRTKGIEATFLAGGSIAFGMANKTSDFDIIYAGETSWYGTGNNGHYGLANLHPFLVKELSLLMGRKVEVCEAWMNWECMIPVIRDELDHPDRDYGFGLSHLSMFYQLYHINRPIDGTLDQIIEDISGLRRKNEKINLELKHGNYIPGYYEDSFKSYHIRLSMRGIAIPTEVIETEAQLIERRDKEDYVASELERNRKRLCKGYFDSFPL
jgi:hypothetical protein